MTADLMNILDGESDPSWYAGTAMELRRLRPIIERAVGQAVLASEPDDAVTELREGWQALEDAAALLDRIHAELEND